RKFFLSLGRQVEAVFADTHKKADTWLRNVLAPLRQQINDYKESLDQRSKSLMKIHQNSDALQANILTIENTLTTLQEQSALLDRLLLKLMHDAKPRLIEAANEIDAAALA
ncbi:MAG: hypothetical protein Q8J65_10555, partial [Nitrosomonadales bacterium]|nr:hypothetical protein [Nitrosomonadales bacterium]